MEYHRWGFWLGVAFFNLSIPASFAVNICTPRILNRWASRSLRAGADRARDLGLTIAHLEELDATADFQRRMLRSAYWLSITALLVGALAAGSGPYPDPGQYSWLTILALGSLGMASGRVTSMLSHSIVLWLSRPREELGDGRAAMLARESRNSPEGDGDAKVFRATIVNRRRRRRSLGGWRSTTELRPLSCSNLGGRRMDSHALIGSS